MKIARYILASLLLLFFSSSVSAFDEIKGMFGVEIGNSLDTYENILFTSNIEDIYTFKPQEISTLFNTYDVVVTKEKIIYRIFATNLYIPDEDFCKPSMQEQIIGLKKSMDIYGIANTIQAMMANQ